MPAEGGGWSGGKPPDRKDAKLSTVCTGVYG